MTEQRPKHLVAQVARRAGIEFPVHLSPQVWQQCIDNLLPITDETPDELLWLMLWTLRVDSWNHGDPQAPLISEIELPTRLGPRRFVIHCVTRQREVFIRLLDES